MIDESLPLPIAAIAHVQTVVRGIRSCGPQEREDFIVPDARDAVALEVEVWVQQRVGAVEVEKSDAEVVERGEGGKGTHGLDDEFLEGVDEVHLVDARRVVVAVAVAAAAPAAVAHDEIDGFQAGGVAELLRGFAGRREEAATDTAGVAEGFEIWENLADIAADMEGGIETAPFVW